MTDYTELKRLLDGCKESSCADAEDFGRRISDLYDYLDPETVAEMIAENERLAANVKLNLCDYPAIHRGDVDLLISFISGTSQTDLAELHQCTPPNISRKIRRVKERLGWKTGMGPLEIHARADQLRALASQGAVVTADLMAERDQLKTENEALRKDADKWKTVKRAGDQLLADEGGAAIWSACSRVLITLSHELNSTRSVVTEDGVTKDGVEIGDWRITVERIDAALSKGEQP